LNNSSLEGLSGNGSVHVSLTDNLSSITVNIG
jgi:hypothetical protein